MAVTSILVVPNPELVLLIELGYTLRQAYTLFMLREWYETSESRRHFSNGSKKVKVTNG